jgi:hypothetical protein
MTISIAHAPRFTRLVYAYEKHLKSKVPGSLLKNASFGGSPTHEELERMVLEALALGRPVPEWEAELEAIRRIPRDQRSLDELFDVPD